LTIAISGNEFDITYQEGPEGQEQTYESISGERGAANVASDVMIYSATALGSDTSATDTEAASRKLNDVTVFEP
jgi:hypothetical protein